MFYDKVPVSLFYTSDGTLIVKNMYVKMTQKRYKCEIFTAFQSTNQHCLLLAFWKLQDTVDSKFSVDPSNEAANSHEQNLFNGVETNTMGGFRIPRYS